MSQGSGKALPTAADNICRVPVTVPGAGVDDDEGVVADVFMREAVFATVVHDLGNPAAAIRLWAVASLQEAKLTATSEALRKALRNILEASEHMQCLIDELGDLARIQRGRLAIDRRLHEVGDLVTMVCEMLEPLARRKDQRLHRKTLLKPLRVFCDRERFVRVMANIIGNAIKFTPVGGEVIVGAEPSGAGLLVSVTDTGPGIGGLDLPKIFEPYWKADQTDPRGSGLGLYIARGIVIAHGGQIWAESEPGRGSTFSFIIPGPIAVDGRTVTVLNAHENPGRRGSPT